MIPDDGRESYCSWMTRCVIKSSNYIQERYFYAIPILLFSFIFAVFLGEDLLGLRDNADDVQRSVIGGVFFFLFVFP